MNPNRDLQESFGSIDIYLFDQLLKGRFGPEMRLLDAGCGGGRNLVYFFRNGYEVYGVDQSATAIREIRALASQVAPQLSPENFRVEPVEKMSFADEIFDVVISSAVLHFARDRQHWWAMLTEMWRVLKAGGVFFARLASTIGMEAKVRPIEGRRYHLPDGSERYLVDEEILIEVSGSLGGQFLEPIKTVVVQDMRAMTTWCLRKQERLRG